MPWLDIFIWKYQIESNKLKLQSYERNYDTIFPLVHRWRFFSLEECKGIRRLLI
jgi:hypothetical protein